jgi:hypothetical protein
MLSLEVVGPDVSLSTLLIPRLPGGAPVREHPGSSNADSSIQLRLVGGGARLLAGGWLVAAVVELPWFLMVMDPKLCDFVCFIHIRPFSYQTIVKNRNIWPYEA